MSTDQPEWRSGDPQSWDTYWRACYQIVGSKTVVVEEFARTEKAALAVADEALHEALKEIAKHGVKVEASCWANKHQSRRQNRYFPATGMKKYVTTDWFGQVRVALKGIAESDQRAARADA